MVEAAEAIGRFIQGLDQAAFETDEKSQAAVLQKIAVLGEAAKNLSPEFREAHPEVPWKDLMGIRDRLVHAYFNVDTDILWLAAQNGAPLLVQTIKPLIQAD